MKINYGKACRFMLTAALILASACVSTRITSDWKDESYQEKPGKIIVLASFKDMTQRRIMEDELTSRLKDAGAPAIQAYAAFPEEKPEEAAIAPLLSQAEADALLTIRVVDRKIVREYFPGPGYYPPISEQDWCAYANGFYNPYSFPPGFAPLNPSGYAPAFPSGYHPGYIDEEVFDVAETNLYDTATQKIVWSAVTKSEIYGHPRAEIESCASEIIKSLRQKNIIR